MIRCFWTVFCDHCGDWRGEVPDKREAIRMARADGFVHRRSRDGHLPILEWLCATCAKEQVKDHD